MSVILHEVLNSAISSFGEAYDASMKRTAEEVLIKKPSVSW